MIENGIPFMAIRKIILIWCRKFNVLFRITCNAVIEYAQKLFIYLFIIFQIEFFKIWYMCCFKLFTVYRQCFQNVLFCVEQTIQRYFDTKYVLRKAPFHCIHLVSLSCIHKSNEIKLHNLHTINFIRYTMFSISCLESKACRPEIWTP